MRIEFYDKYVKNKAYYKILGTSISDKKKVGFLTKIMFGLVI